MVEAVDEAAVHGVVHLVGYAQVMATFPPFGGIAREVAFGFLEGFIARKVAAVGKLEDHVIPRGRFRGRGVFTSSWSRMLRPLTVRMSVLLMLVPLEVMETR